MKSQSPTESQDVGRLREELPEGLSDSLVSAARLFEGSAKLGLQVALWPASFLPRTFRDGVGRTLRAAVATTALLPHGLVRAVGETADDLLAEPDQK